MGPQNVPLPALKVSELWAPVVKVVFNKTLIIHNGYFQNSELGALPSAHRIYFGY